MRNRLQMGAAGTSRTRKDNPSVKAIGFNQHDLLITGDISMTLLGKQEDGHSVPVVFTMKIRCGKPGGGKGPLIQKDKSATLGCNNDQYLFVPLHGEVAPPLDASYYKGCGERNGIEREVIAVKRQRTLPE